MVWLRGAGDLLVDCSQRAAGRRGGIGLRRLIALRPRVRIAGSARTPPTLVGRTASGTAARFESYGRSAAVRETSVSGCQGTGDGCFCARTSSSLHPQTVGTQIQPRSLKRLRRRRSRRYGRLSPTLVGRPARDQSVRWTLSVTPDGASHCRGSWRLRTSKRLALTEMSSQQHDTHCESGRPTLDRPGVTPSGTPRCGAPAGKAQDAEDQRSRRATRRPPTRSGSAMLRPSTDRFSRVPRRCRRVVPP